MIRINLLPVSDGDRIAQGRLHLLIFAGVLLMVLALLGLIFMATNSEVEELKNRRDAGKAEVAKLKRESDETNALNREADLLQKQLDVLGELKQGRTGPVRMLDELKAMLNKPRNEEDRFAQLQKNWNVEWDPKRLWLGEFKEIPNKKGASGNTSFAIAGAAMNHDDVAEFLQRLNTAEHFFDIQLDEVVSAPLKVTNTKTVPKVNFTVNGKISYLGKSKEPKKKAPAPGKKGRPKKK